MAKKSSLSDQETIEILIRAHPIPFSTALLMSLPLRKIVLLCRVLHEQLLEAKEMRPIKNPALKCIPEIVENLESELKFAKSKIDDLEDANASLQSENDELNNWR